MIEYNWKMEITASKREAIRKIRQGNDGGLTRIHSVDIIIALANTLDRYETILNEVEGDSNYAD